MATVSFRIDDDLKSEVDDLTERMGLNVSHLFRQTLSQSLEALRRSPKERDTFAPSMKERLILANQYRILAGVDPKNAKYHERNAEIVESGYEYHYRDLLEHFSDGFSIEQSREVLDILDMYADLLFSYEHLDDKSEIEEYLIQFPGFDGNNESEIARYAVFFCLKLDRFNSLHSRVGLNSHMPTLDRYRRMIPVFKARRKAEMPPLTKEDIQAILNAKRSR